MALNITDSPKKGISIWGFRGTHQEEDAVHKEQ
jgi:hypothetical protein